MSNRFAQLFKHTPFRILLPSLLMFLLFAGSIFGYLLPSIETALMNKKKETIFELTGSMVATLEHLYHLEQQEELTREEAQEIGYQTIKELRYGPEGKDYFWINDTEYRMVMHPYRGDLEGQNLKNFKDKQGKLLFVELVDTATENGSGFVDYHWQWQDQPDRVIKKLSFVREFKPWGWVIGTGLYLDSVEKEIAGYRNLLSAIFLTILIVFAILKIYILRQTALAEEKRSFVVAEREKLVCALQDSEERYRTVADFAYDWEVWISAEEKLLYCSPSCERITGYPPERFFDKPGFFRSLIINEDRDAWDRYLAALKDHDGDILDFRIHSRDSRMRWLNVVGRSVMGMDGKPLGIRCSFRDITDRKEMEGRLRHQALHDPLTGLANRTLCLDRISQAMHRAKRRDNYYFAVIFLDLDRFKIINDSLGHHFGDRVLIETAARLKDIVRNLDTVSRFGGDEFVLLLDELASPGEAIRIIKRLRKALARPFSFHDNEVQTTASFGIVLSPIGDIAAADVLQHANIAMHRAKETGRNRFKVFTSRMLENAVDQLSLENDLRRSLEQNELHVEYQPIMNLNGSDLVGFEALARWHHPVRGEISPVEFIPLAEETGIILQLGEWVLRTALEALAGWNQKYAGCEDLFVAVNVSGKQFARMELDKVVMEILYDSNISPHQLKLEITESAILDQPETAVRVLKVLRDQGVRFSIDDFGTGYSSLSQLQKLPVDTLKVDRSFISRMMADPENMEIVKAVIALAHSLDLDVVAEGVEDSSQLCSLIDLNCECVQGFYFHKPLIVNDVEALLQKRAEDGGMQDIRIAKALCLTDK